MHLIGGLLGLCGAIATLAGVGIAHARLLEERINVPVKVADARGRQVERDIVVTVFYDVAAPKPFPLLILNHGRAVDARGRAAVGRARFTEAAGFFAGLGFIVAVPTRVGYGVTGGDDVEDSGDCKTKNYPPVYQAAAVQTLIVMETLRERSYVAKDRTVIAGQSFGGTTAITVAAQAVPGVAATINFAGGGGGNPETRPGNPCAPGALTDLFAAYGKSARIPTLWIYTENDKYMGAVWPRRWFDAFKAAGGAGEFRQFPPHGEDGHLLFSRAPTLWQPRVLEFLRTLGYKPFLEQ